MMIAAPRKRIKRDWWEHGTGKQQARWWTPTRYWKLLEGIEQGRTDEWIARQLGTTAVAVNLARKRAGISSRVPGVLNARDAAKLLGIPCEKTVVRWIKQGWLSGRRGRSTGHYQQWRITQDALRSFLSDPEHWHRWDARRITDPYLRRWALSLPKPRYLTPGEVAARCFVEHPTVNHWIRSGLLPAVRNGNWLVPESALDGFIPPGQRPRNHQTHRRFTAFEDKLLLSARQNGLGYTEIARQLGRPIGSVYGRYHRLSGRRNAA